MIIDILLAILLCMAALKGYQKGLIVGLFSYLAFVIGLAAAMKLSTVAASRIGEIVKISDKWLPFIAFIAVLIGVIILVRWIAALIEFSVKKIMLGWANRLGGIVFFSMLYVAVYAIILFYLNQLRFIPASVVEQSAAFELIESFGRKALGATGIIIPAFRDMFHQLEGFFEKIPA